MPTAKTYFNNDTVAAVVVWPGCSSVPDSGLEYHGAIFDMILDPDGALGPHPGVFCSGWRAGS